MPAVTGVVLLILSHDVGLRTMSRVLNHIQLVVTLGLLRHERRVVTNERIILTVTVMVMVAAATLIWVTLRDVSELHHKGCS